MEVGSFIPLGKAVNCRDTHKTPWMMNVVLDKIIQDPPGRPAIF
jgi:hypothetical protein